MGAAVSISKDKYACTDCYYNKYEKDLAPKLRKEFYNYFNLEYP